MFPVEYHLGEETRNNKHYFVLSLVDAKGPVRSLEPLLQSADRARLIGLVTHHKRAFGGFEGKLYLPRDESFDALCQLGGTGRLFYQGRKIVIDPFSKWSFQVAVRSEAKGRAQLRGQCCLKGVVSDLTECDWVFPADPSWVIHGGVLRQIDAPISWVKWGKQTPQVLEGAALIDWLDDAKEEVTLIREGEALEVEVIEPLPTLVLKDRHGAFADLHFIYPDREEVSFHAPQTHRWRVLASEKGFEKDLLETDFQRKQVDSSHYYCPLDKVAKSLTFLMEIGWQIRDMQGKRVIRQGGKPHLCEILLNPEEITLRAQIRYADHEVDLHAVVGAFNRRERFLQISPTEVGLITFDPSAWVELSEAEVTTEGIRFPKRAWGLLDLWKEDPEREISSQAALTLSELQAFTPLAIAPAFQGTLFPYQKEGVDWLQFLYQGGWGGLLADEMGLGKTVQVLAFFSQLKTSKPLLVVAPTSLVFNWCREVKTFLPSLTPFCYEGEGSVEEWQQKPLILVSYARLRLAASLFASLEFEVIVFDEAQTLKNPDSQIAQVCARLRGRSRIALTGTPIENKLEDLWSLFHCLQPALLGERRAFEAEWKAAQASPRYWEKIRRKTRPFLLRRKKTEVAIQLPPKSEQVVFVEMASEQRALYEQYVQRTQQGLLQKVSLSGGASAHRMEILEALLRLRQLCAHPGLLEPVAPDSLVSASAKLERLMADVQEVVEEGSKVLIYSQFTSMLRLIEQAIRSQGWGYTYLDGSTKDREGAVLQFQTDPQCSIFLISLKAGGVGLNLTAADYVFLYDPWWNEAAERQAIDRAHRVGRQGCVIARRYVTALSVEEKMMRLKTHKVSLAEAILEEGGAASQFSIEELMALF